MSATRSQKDKTVQSTEDVPAVTPESQQQVAIRPRDEIVAEVMRSNVYSDEVLRDLATFEAAVALAQEKHGTIEDVAKVLGDGFALLKEQGKRLLVGIPCMLMEWSFYPGEYGSNFVAVHIVARNPDGGISKYIINDGSTGIADMLAEYTKKTGKTGGLFARNGLSESTYIYCEECGKPLSNADADGEHKAAGKHKKAATYYIDTSA